MSGLVAVTPKDILKLLDKSAAIQDQIELRKIELGVEDPLISTSAVMVLNWSYDASLDDNAAIDTALSVLSHIRRTDRVIRSASNELIVIADSLKTETEALSVAQRLAPTLGANSRVGFVYVDTPMRTSLAIRGAQGALQAENPSVPIAMAFAADLT